MNNMVDKKSTFVQEEVKNLLSIIMGVIPEEAQDQTLEDFREKATLSKDIQAIKELEQSSKEIEEKAQAYVDSIGITSTKSPNKTSKENIAHVDESTLSGIESTIDVFENEKQNTNSDHFDIEL